MFSLLACYAAQNIDPIFGLEDETDMLPRNVCNYESTLRNMPEERGSDSHRGGSFKSLSTKVGGTIWCEVGIGRVR